MKRIAVILLLLVYTASVYGVTINRFFCCGKLTSISLSVNSTPKMDGKAKSSEDCCKTVKSNFKVKDNHVSAKTDLMLKNSFALISPVYPIPTPNEKIISAEVTVYDSQAPPATHRALYMLYANYRI